MCVKNNNPTSNSLADQIICILRGQRKAIYCGMSTNLFLPFGLLMILYRMFPQTFIVSCTGIAEGNEQSDSACHK